MSMAASRTDLPQLFHLLNSSDSITSNEASLILRSMINEGDTQCISFLIDASMSNESELVAGVLSCVREPCDKFLLDKLSDCLKNPIVGTKCVSLLEQIILKQPQWLSNIAAHTAFIRQFCKQIKLFEDAQFSIGGMLCISALLPYLTPVVSCLNEFFLVFTALAERIARHTVCDDDRFDHFDHLQTALFALFSRLYACYPCNFVHFLRCSFGPPKISGNRYRQRRLLLEQVVMPFLSRVKLHFALILSSKEEELTKERWKLLNSDTFDVLLNVNDSIDYSQDVLSQFRPDPMASQKNETSPSTDSALSRSESKISACGFSLSASTDAQRTRSYSGNVKSLLCTQTEQSWSPSVALGLCTPPPIVGRSRTPSGDTWSLSKTTLGDQRSTTTGEDEQLSFVSSLAGHTANFCDESRKRTVSGDTTRPRRSFGQKLGRFFNRPVESKDQMARRKTCRFSSVGASTESFSEIDFNLSNVAETNAEIAEEAVENGDSADRTVLEPEAKTDRSSTVDSSAPIENEEDAEVARLLASTTEHTDLVGTADGNAPRQNDRDSVFSSQHSSTHDNNLKFPSEDCAALFPESSKFQSLTFSFLTDPLRDHSLTVPRIRDSHVVKDIVKRLNSHRFIVETAQNKSNLKNATKYCNEFNTQTPRGIVQKVHSCPMLGQLTPHNGSGDIRKDVLTHVQKTSYALKTAGSEGVRPYDLASSLSARYINDSNGKPEEKGVVYDGFDDYLLASRLLNENLLNNLKNQSVEFYTLHINLLKHQLFYERHKKMIYRRNYCSLYASSYFNTVIESHSDLAKLKSLKLQQDCKETETHRLQEQETEIRHLLDASRNLTEDIALTKQENLEAESNWRVKVMKLRTDKSLVDEKLNSKLGEIDSWQRKYNILKGEFDKTKHELINIDLKLKVEKKEDKTTSIGRQEFFREALVLSEVNSRLKRALVYCRQNHETSIAYSDALLKEKQANFETEQSELRKELKYEKQKNEILSAKIRDLEARLYRKQQHVSELKRQIDEANDTHREHLQALQMKFHALTAVCQRQEVHILSLYEMLENAGDHAAHLISSCDTLESKHHNYSKSLGEQTDSKVRKSNIVQIPERLGSREIVSYDSDGQKSTLSSVLPPQKKSSTNSASYADHNSWFVGLINQEPGIPASRHHQSNSPVSDVDNAPF